MADVVDAIKQHSQSFDAHTESKSAINLRVQVAMPQHRWSCYVAATHFDLAVF